jgi:hypothetical protein
VKVNDTMRFPHPVLWSQCDDYVDGAFAISVAIEEQPDTGRVKAVCTPVVTETALKSLIDSDIARVGVFVTCLDTYFNELFTLPLGGGSFEICGGLLRGQVVLRPMAWAGAPITSFASPNVHAEFGAGPYSFRKGAVLAIAEPSVISIGSDKMVPMGSIFDLAENDTVPRDQFGIQPEGDRIQIQASRATLARIQMLRATQEGKVTLLNAIYLPVVMRVLDLLRADEAIYEGRRWCKVFRAKVDHLGIDIKGDLLEAAQQLLKSPFGRIEVDSDGARS